MASRRFNNAKKSVANGLRKLFLATVAAGTLGGTGYYHIGTQQEIEAKVRNQTSVGEYGEDGFEGHFVFNTDKGDLIVEKATLHGVSQEGARQIYNSTYNGSTYVFKTWGGIPQLGINPKVSSARIVTEQELQDREIEKKKRADEEKAKKAAAAQQPAQGAATPAPAQPQAGAATTQVFNGLSGRVQTVDIVHNNNVIQLTVPVEAVGKVTINAVTPMQVAPAPKPPGQ